jgi:hypothetical protein
MVVHDARCLLARAHVELMQWWSGSSIGIVMSLLLNSFSHLSSSLLLGTLSFLL